MRSTCHCPSTLEKAIRDALGGQEETCIRALDGKEDLGVGAKAACDVISIVKTLKEDVHLCGDAVNADALVQPIAQCRTKVCGEVSRCLRAKSAKELGSAIDRYNSFQSRFFEPLLSTDPNCTAAAPTHDKFVAECLEILRELYSQLDIDRVPIVEYVSRAKQLMEVECVLCAGLHVGGNDRPSGEVAARLKNLAELLSQEAKSVVRAPGEVAKALNRLRELNCSEVQALLPPECSLSLLYSSAVGALHSRLLDVKERIDATLHNPTCESSSPDRGFESFSAMLRLHRVFTTNAELAVALGTSCSDLCNKYAISLMSLADAECNAMCVSDDEKLPWLCRTYEIFKELGTDAECAEARKKCNEVRAQMNSAAKELATRITGFIDAEFESYEKAVLAARRDFPPQYNSSPLKAKSPHVVALVESFRQLMRYENVLCPTDPASRLRRAVAELVARVEDLQATANRLATVPMDVAMPLTQRLARNLCKLYLSIQMDAASFPSAQVHVSAFAQRVATASEGLERDLLDYIQSLPPWMRH